MNKKLFTWLVVIGLFLLFSKISYAISYNPTTDFSIYNGNPNGVWSYGWMPTNFSTFNLYTGSRMDPNFGNSPHWYREPASWDYSPNIIRNDDSISHYNVAPGQLTLHPSSTYEPSVLRWTSPYDGLYNFNGQFFSGDIGTMQIGIRQGSNWLWQGVDSGSFNFDRSMTAGESIDFLVYGAYFFGNTPLELTIDTVTPVVISTSPVNLATDVVISTNITATFSESMDASTINTSTFTLKDSANNPVSGVVSYNASTKTATFDPDSNLVYSATYTATITTGVKDLGGNNMAADKVWSFTTQASSPTSPTQPSSPPVPPTGYNTYWLLIVGISLMSGGGHLLLRGKRFN